MNRKNLDAAIAYLPLVGWIYVALLPGKSDLSRFHMRQSIGLAIFLVGIFAGWAVLAWLLAWLPFALIAGVSLFTVVMVAMVFGIIAWIMGIMNALRGVMAPLPIFGRWAHNLFE